MTAPRCVTDRAAGVEAGRQHDAVERQPEGRDASKSSSWKRRPSAASAKYEQVLDRQRRARRQQLGAGLGRDLEAAGGRSIRAIETRSTAKASRTTAAARGAALGRSQRVGDVVRQRLSTASSRDVLPRQESRPRASAATPRAPPRRRR